MSPLTFWEGLAAIVGMLVVTVVSRGFFFIGDRERPLPPWLERGLRVAPLAALAAVVAPEVLTWQAHWIDPTHNPRLVGAVAAAAWYAWRRDILGTIACGMAAMTLARWAMGA